MRDTRLAAKPRSYYFDRDRDIADSVAWALGGALEHQSGWWKERLRIATTLVMGAVVMAVGADNPRFTHMKRRNSDNFEPMSRAAGLRGTDEPVSLVGMRYNFTKSVNLGFVKLYAWEFMNTFYAEGNTGWQVTDELSIGTGGQFTDQRSVGDELTGNFDTSVYGARVSTTYKGATVSLAFSSTDNGGRIRSPFGGYPGYLSLMVKDFNRAGEDAWLVGLAYDFAEVGWNGISGYVNYAEGYVSDSDSTGAPDQAELDVTLDIRPTNGVVDVLMVCGCACVTPGSIRTAALPMMYATGG